MITPRTSLNRFKKTSLAIALIATLSPVVHEAQAGVMVPDYDPQLYGDLATGKGVFASGKTNIKIYDLKGNLRGELPSGIDPQGVADKLYLTMVDPQFGTSATHVGYTSTVTFGNHKTFIFNDGTLFEGSGTSKPFNGKSVIEDINEWKRLIFSGEYNNWLKIFTKYLGVSYQASGPDKMYWQKNNGSTDFKIDRYLKLNIETIPYEMIDDHHRMKEGDRVLHIGAGTTEIWDRETGTKTGLIYSTPVGGTGLIHSIGDAGAKQSWTNPNNKDVDQNRLLYGNSFWISLTKEWNGKDVLEQFILGGDSGSPVFWFDENDNKWKLVGATSAINGANFGSSAKFLGNMEWVRERIEYYKQAPITLKEGEKIVFHGQNAYNGQGYLHILQETATDTEDTNLAKDIEKVKTALDLDSQNQVYIYEGTAKYNAAKAEWDKKKKANPNLTEPAPKKEDYVKAQKPGITLPKAEDFKNTQLTDTADIRFIEYTGFLQNYEYGLVGSNGKKIDNLTYTRKYDAATKERSLTFNGAGVGSKHLITFGSDITVNNNTVHLGGDSITLNSGDFILKADESLPANQQIKSFINAGYIINEGASLSWQLQGEAGDAIHKLGLGTLRIEGKGDQLSPLNVGQGVTELNREGGTATPYLKIGSGRAIVRLMRDGQLVRNLDGVENNVAVGFAQNGGVLDFNGFDKQQTWRDIYHFDKGATLANLAEGDDKKVTFTFAPNGKRSYLGSFLGNLDIVYNPTVKTTADDATWYLKNTVNTTGDFKLTEKTTLQLGDVRTERGWGQFFDDRYDQVTFLTGTTTMENGSALHVGRNTIFSSVVNAGENTTVTIHNRDKLIAADDHYPIENQAQVEKTVVAGSLTLAPTAKAIVDVEAGHVIDLFSDVHGQGALTLTGKGLINVGGNNDFTGSIKICETNSTSTDCTTKITFENKLAEDYTYDPLVKPELPEILAPTEATTDSANSSVASNTDASDASDNAIAAPAVNATPVLAALSTNLQPITLASVDYSGFALAESEEVVAGNAANGTDTSDATTSPGNTTTKPTVEQFEFDSHKDWTTNEIEEAQKAEQDYTHDAQDQNLHFVPAPAADSLILNFFSKRAVFQNTSLVDTTNAKVVFYTNFADAQADETVTWDFSNYQGDAFIVKDGDYALQIKNHNLAGTFFLKAGSLIADQIGSHLVIGKGTSLYADARGTTHEAILQGRVYNAGTIYITQKAELLPETVFESNKLTVTPPTITVPSAPSTTVDSNNTSSDTTASSYSTNSSNTTASNEAESITLAGYMTFANGITLANDVNLLEAGATPRDNTMEGDKLVTGGSSDARRDLAVLTINGDYVGDNGKIVYDLAKDAYQVHIKGNVSGTTTLDIKDIDAVTAAGRESFDLLIADGNIQQDALTLQSNYVSGGVYDYITSYAGNKIKLVSYIAEEKVEVVPSVSVGNDPNFGPTFSEELPEWTPETGGKIESVESQDGQSFPTTSPELPTFDMNSVAGARFINSSVGTQLANRRFISNLNVNPLDLTSRPGFYLDVDRDSEALTFQGANYKSSYEAKRTLVGNNFQIGKQSNVGIFASTSHANSTITNMVNSATGEVKAYGLGVTAGTQLGSFELAGSAQYVYADNNVTGTHNQHETLHGGFVAAQAAVALPQIGDNTNYFSLKPYVLLQAEFTPTSHFVSRLGEELGTVMAHRYTQATGIKAATHLNKLALEVDAYKNLGQRTTEFNSYYTADHIAAMNNNFRVKTTLSYQVLPSVKVSTYFNTQGSHQTSGVSLDVKW